MWSLRNCQTEINDETQVEVDLQTQSGVQDMEALTTVWSTKSLVIAYILIWLIYFVEGLLSGTQIALNPYITSAFAAHSLTPTVGIVSSIVSGVINFTIAKLLDVFGRPQGFLVCIVIACLGLVMMAACRTVEAYAAAQVFHSVEITGLQFTLGVFIADTSSLKNRGLMQANASLPLIILGTGLLMHFRRANTDIGYIVMCQIFIGLAQGIIIVADEIAALATVSHQHIAVTLATIGIFGSIGGAIGLTIVAAIWQAVFPKKLAVHLPEQDLLNLPLIYGDSTTQLSYEIGSPTRIAVQHAYGDTQRCMALTATVIWVLGVMAVGMWRDIKVSDMKQVRGHVV
ncbi:hypothetical protein E4T42_03730 [Aureobasidium subglaciale]|nr:hypothetical protein E4T42_03730 [Aureobasidium subglaciale]